MKTKNESGSAGQGKEGGPEPDAAKKSGKKRPMDTPAEGHAEKKKAKKAKKAKGPKPPKAKEEGEAAGSDDAAAAGPGSRVSIKDYKALQAAAEGICSAPPEEQAEWIWGHCQRVTKATPIEREDYGGFKAASMARLKGIKLEDRILSAFRVDNSWHRSLTQPMDTSAEKGVPRVLIISGNAVSANNAAKALPRMNKAARIGKLYARHFKVQEQIEFLSQAPVNVAVGTPNRLLKLIEEGALRLTQLRLVVLDVKRDLKMRTMLDMPETSSDLWQLYKQLRGRLAEGQLEVALTELE